MGDNRGFMNFNPDTTNTTQFWNARTFRNSARFMQGGLCSDVSSGCFAGSFVGKSFKHNATAKEFEKSLENLLEDLSSSTGSYENIPPLSLTNERCNYLPLESCSDPLSPQSFNDTHSPQPGRPVKSCLNLSLVAPPPPPPPANTPANMPPQNGYSQGKDHGVSQQGILIDVNIRHQPRRTAMIKQNRPQSEHYYSTPLLKPFRPYPLQKANSLLEMTLGESEEHPKIKQSHSFNFGSTIESMISELDDAINELHEFANSMSDNTISSQRSENKTHERSPVCVNLHSDTNVKQQGEHNQYNGNKPGEKSYSKGHYQGKTKWPPTGALSMDESDSDTSNLSERSSFSEACPTIVVSSDDINSNEESSSAEETLTFDLDPRCSKSQIVDKFICDVPKTTGPNPAWVKSNSVPSFHSDSVIDDSSDSYKRKSDEIIYYDNPCFENELSHYDQQINLQTSTSTWQGKVTSANVSRQKLTNCTTYGCSTKSQECGNNFVSHTNVNTNSILNNKNINNFSSSQYMITGKTSDGQNGKQQFSQAKWPRQSNTEAINSGSSLTRGNYHESKPKPPQLAKVLKTHSAFKSGSATDFTFTDSEMGYTADLDTCTDTPKIAGEKSNWRDLEPTTNYAPQSNLDPCFVPPHSFRPLKFVGIEYRYMIKPDSNTNELRVPTPIKLRKEIATQTYELTPESDSRARNTCFCKNKTSKSVSISTQTDQTLPESDITPLYDLSDKKTPISPLPHTVSDSTLLNHANASILALKQKYRANLEEYQSTEHHKNSNSYIKSDICKLDAKNCNVISTKTVTQQEKQTDDKPVYVVSSGSHLSQERNNKLPPTNATNQIFHSESLPHSIVIRNCSQNNKPLKRHNTEVGENKQISGHNEKPMILDILVSLQPNNGDNNVNYIPLYRSHSLPNVASKLNDIREDNSNVKTGPVHVINGGAKKQTSTLVINAMHGSCALGESNQIDHSSVRKSPITTENIFFLPVRLENPSTVNRSSMQKQLPTTQTQQECKGKKICKSEKSISNEYCEYVQMSSVEPRPNVFDATDAQNATSNLCKINSQRQLPMVGRACDLLVPIHANASLDADKVTANFTQNPAKVCKSETPNNTDNSFSSKSSSFSAGNLVISINKHNNNNSPNVLHQNMSLHKSQHKTAIYTDDNSVKVVCNNNRAGCVSSPNRIITISSDSDASPIKINTFVSEHDRQTDAIQLSPRTVHSKSILSPAQSASRAKVIHKTNGNKIMQPINTSESGLSNCSFEAIYEHKANGLSLSVNLVKGARKTTFPLTKSSSFNCIPNQNCTKDITYSLGRSGSGFLQGNRVKCTKDLTYSLIAVKKTSPTIKLFVAENNVCKAETLLQDNTLSDVSSLEDLSASYSDSQ